VTDGQTDGHRRPSARRADGLKITCARCTRLLQCSYVISELVSHEQVRKVLRTQKVAPSGDKSKTIDLAGMMSRMCMLSFVTFRCVLTKP